MKVAPLKPVCYLALAKGIDANNLPVEVRAADAQVTFEKFHTLFNRLPSIPEVGTLRYYVDSQGTWIGIQPNLSI